MPDDEGATQRSNGSEKRHPHDFRVPEPEVRRDRAEPTQRTLVPDPGFFEVVRRARTVPPPIKVPEPERIERVRGTPRTDVTVPEAGEFDVARRARVANNGAGLEVPHPTDVQQVRGTPRSDVEVPQVGPFDVAKREPVAAPRISVPEPSEVQRDRGVPRADVAVPTPGPYEVAQRTPVVPPPLSVPPPSEVHQARGTPRTDVEVPRVGPAEVAPRPHQEPPRLSVPEPNEVQQVRGTPRQDVSVPRPGPYEVAPRRGEPRPAPDLRVPPPSEVQRLRGSPRTDVEVPTAGTPHVAERPVRDPGPNPLVLEGRVEARVDQPPKRAAPPLPNGGPVEVRQDQPVRTDVPALPVDPGRLEIQTNALHRRARVLTTGVFDLIHLGHIHMLEAAKKLGDELVVVIARDETVRRMKHEPLNNEEVRRQIVERLKPVDKAVLGHHGDIYRIVTEIRPDIVALGYDQSFKEEEVERRCRGHGVDVQVVRLPQFDHDLDATRKIIERIGDRLQKRELYTRREN